MTRWQTNVLSSHRRKMHRNKAQMPPSRLVLHCMVKSASHAEPANSDASRCLFLRIPMLLALLIRSQCNGARPCGPCLQRRLLCKYATVPGQSHLQAKKERIKELENDKSAMFEILWYLQTNSLDKASELLQHLRSVRGADYGAVLEKISRAGSGSSSGLGSPSTHTSDSSSGVQVDHPASEVMQYQQSPFIIDQHIAGSVEFTDPPTGQDATVDGIRAAIDMFFMCIGGLFYVFDKSDVEKTIELLVMSTKGMTLANLVSSASSMEVRTLAAELAGMAAMGILHLRLRVPDKAPSAQLADYLYAVAKHGLDTAIQYNPLRAMKVCLLLAFYNIALHATVALAYIGKCLTIASLVAF
jgi:hypothetical protein